MHQWTQKPRRRGTGSWARWFVVCWMCLTPCGAGATPQEDAAKSLISHLVAGEYSAVTATFDSKMQGALPADKLGNIWQQLVAQAGAFNTVQAVRTETKGEYAIVIATCDFAKVLLDVKVVYDTKGQVAGLFFAPTQAADAKAPDWKAPAYVDAAKFSEESVTIDSGTWKLPGVLARPKGAGPFPAVVLVHGSGPQDADETVGAIKPFRDLAQGLASRNIVVLRYVKRTQLMAEQGNASIAGLTVQQETVDDAIAAVALLGKTAGVDAAHIWIVGHSLGAYLAPRIATQERRVAGIVCLAGNVRPMEDLIVDQLRFLANADGSVSDNEKAQIESAERMRTQVRSPELKAESEVTVLGTPLPGSYWLDLRGYDPAQLAAGLRIPVRVLQGGRDYQVTQADFDLWKKALAGRANAACTWYPDLNHLFVAGQGAAGPAEYAQPGNVDGRVIDELATAIGPTARPKPR
jgi:dienelactone hydrolase